MKAKVLPLEQLPAGLKAVFDYWQGLGGENLHCSWKTFELMEVPSVLLTSTLVIDVFPDINENRYRYWGSAMTRLHGRDMTGLSPYALTPEDFAEAVRQDHRMIIQNRKPYARIYGFKSDIKFDHTHTALGLPLSDDGETVHQIVVVIEFTDKGSDYLNEVEYSDPDTS